MNPPSSNPDRASCAFRGSGAQWTRSKRRDVFREMVIGELRCGPLTRMRRRRLVQYAARLDLSAVEAGRLIREAQRAVQDEADDPAARPSLRLAERHDPSPVRYKLYAVLVTAVLLNALLLRWILG